MKTTTINMTGMAFIVATVVVLALPPAAQAMYDPKHGRWLQGDPLGVRPSGSRNEVRVNRMYEDAMNTHEYGRNNPPLSDDPDGTCCCRVKDFGMTFLGQVLQPVYYEVKGREIYAGMRRFEPFIGHAAFVDNGFGHCCEYRQLMKGTVRTDNVTDREHLTWTEDVTVEGLHLGHRSSESNRDEDYYGSPRYLAEDPRLRGLKYAWADAPGMFGVKGSRLEYHIQFLGLIIDTCGTSPLLDLPILTPVDLPLPHDQVVAWLTWSVDFDWIVPMVAGATSSAQDERSISCPYGDTLCRLSWWLSSRRCVSCGSQEPNGVLPLQLVLLSVLSCMPMEKAASLKLK